ncbi:MAG: MASE1 domain-containing protein [Betaproteobacteria bacterium]|nr:MASE1 domain-containing protein [Betaproteobacteria bacterium]
MTAAEMTTYRWTDLPRLAVLAALYALLANLMVSHFSGHALISYVWPPSGLALAALLIGGRKYWPAIFVGVFAHNFIADRSIGLAFSLALGSTLEALIGFWLLSGMLPKGRAVFFSPGKPNAASLAERFDPALSRPRDYLQLVGAGAIGSTVGALIGSGAFLQAGFLAPSAFAHSLLAWWMGDALGIMLTAPLILVWRQAPRDWLKRERMIEITICLLLAFVFGQAIFLVWFGHSIGRGYWMLLFVAWGAVRFGRHGALLILGMVAVQGLLGALQGIGYFGRTDTGQTLLDNYWFYMVVLNLVGMLLATIINQRGLAEQALRAAEERWSFALEGAGDGVWDWNIRTGEVTFSKRWREMFGFAQDEAVDQIELWRNRVHPEDLQRALADEQAYFEGKTASYVNEHRVQCRDGSWKWILERGMVVSRSPDGTPLRMIGTQTDITMHKKAEEALQLAAIELRQRKEEAERTSLAKSRFLAAASHDLRQPLHALSLFAAEFEQQPTSPAQNRLLRQISSAIDAMNVQLDSLLDISRLDLDDAAPCRAALALAPLLERVVAMHQRSADAKGLRLRLLPTAAWAESHAPLLERMLGNLIANAVRYTRQGSIVIAVRRNADDWRIEVRDSGIGIDTGQLSLIFQEFYQVGNPERDAGKGLGLGLAIVARLGQLLNHRIVVRSASGRGSVFGIVLPRAAPVGEIGEISQHGAARALPCAGEFNFHAGVLVGCGSDAASVSLCNLLEGWGCRVTHAADDSALRIALASQPDVLICDEHSYAVAAAGANANRMSTPILILLGNPPNQPGQTGAKIHGHLTRPLQPARLRALLQHLLEESRRPG